MADEAQNEIGRAIAQIKELHEFVDSLSRKMGEIDAAKVVNAEFIRRSLASIYDSQTILAANIVRVLETLQAHGLEMPPSDEIAETDARPKPFLRLVDPEAP